MAWTGEDKTYRRNEAFVQREVAGEFILVPIRHQQTEATSLYVLNETGAALWRRLDGRRSIHAILDEVSDEFDVSEAQLDRDVVTFIEDLLSIRAIEKVLPAAHD